MQDSGHNGIESLESRVMLHAGHEHVLDVSDLAEVHGLASGVVPWMIAPLAVSQPAPDPDPNPDPGPDPDPGPVDTFTGVTWTTRAPSPIVRAEASRAVVGSKLYVFGGFQGKLGPVTRSDVYDPATNTWTRIKDFPERTTHAAVVSDDRYVYLAGGYVGFAGGTGYGQTFGTRNVWRYDTVTDTYDEMPKLPAAVASGGAGLVNGRMHYFGGFDLAREDTNVHYVLDLNDPSGGWTSAAAIPKSRNHMGSAALGGKLYAISGQAGLTGTTEVNVQREVQIYDPATDSWSEGAPIPRGLSHISGGTFVMGGRIIVAGGESADARFVRDVYAYTPSTDKWTTLTPLPAGRFSGVAGVIGGSIYFTTGGSDVTWKGEPII